jgi:hypothetical protein
MPRGQFVHESMAKARSMNGEAAIGWIAHYVIGTGYGVLLLAFWGRPWITQPTFLPPMILSWVLLVAPYFIMMPGAAFFHPYVESRRVSMLLHHREPVQALHSGTT